ncbi:cation transporter [Selenihalanaerobacter shriftii]|uniref:Heavy-metal-associated domain-containing protein n=1 Tax=Selenihalanaerobacter shriftii TaxID=142842 RepID=A0A1T4M7I3_9FIRM|nr:cation transporter [Selenihalanaerobacter shriftii]SJZ62796.1 Heavy-metal-associated domain-containing protein [Selenihalanaerobacter shriftii]
MKNKKLYLKDLACPDCAQKVEKILNKQTGVREAKVHYTTSKAKVEFNEDEITIDELKKAVATTGYEVERVS